MTTTTSSYKMTNSKTSAQPTASSTSFFESAVTDQQQLIAQLLAQQQMQQAVDYSNAAAQPHGLLEQHGNLAQHQQHNDHGDLEDDKQTNLIINYLPQTMSQEEVRSLFCSIGEVESCKLIKDKATGQSLGYAFVNYFRPEDAQRALQSLNGLRLQNKMIKVSVARPSNESIKGANLYVSGVPKSITQPELEAIFKPFGSIVTSRILFDNATGLSKGVGFVRFDRKQEAEVAIEKLNGTIPFGGEEKITVKFANNPAASSTKSTAIQIAQAASALLPLQMLQNSLGASLALGAVSAAPLLNQLPVVSAATQSYGGGPIHHQNSHHVRYSPLVGNPLINGGAGASLQGISANAFQTMGASLLNGGMGIMGAQQLNGDYNTALLQLQQQLALQQVQQSTSPSAIAAAQAQAQIAAYNAAISAATVGSYSNNHQTIAHQSASVTPNGTNGSSGAGHSLFVSNLTAESDEPVLWRLFGPFGAVLSVKIVKDFTSNKCKGYGFVTMANYDDAVAAINALNGSQLGSRNLQVSFKSQSSVMLATMVR